MLAYKPGLVLFISVLYHTLHLITNSVVQQVRACASQPSPASLVCYFMRTLRKERSGSGEGTGQKESLSPTFLREIYLYILRSLTAL